MRRIIAWTSAVALAVGLTTIPLVATAQISRTTTSFATTCYIAAPNVVGLGGPMDITPENPVQIHVTAPESVDVGDTFEVSFEIDPINVSLDSLPGAISLQQASRLKLDLQRPAGARLVGTSFDGGNIDVSQAQVITVNDSGVLDPNGNVLRLTNTGHHTIGNGGNVSTNGHAGLGMNLRGASALDIEFPRVTLTFEAERAGAATVGVRTQGNASVYGANPASFLTLLASASVPLLGTQWVPGYCSPRGSTASPIDRNAAALKSIDIRGLPTSTSLAGPDTVYLRTPAEFVATVEPRIPGEVTFLSASQRSTVPVDTATGQARAELTFTSVGADPVTATFTPTDPRYARTSAELVVTPQRVPTQMTIGAPATTNANTRTALSALLPGDARGTVTFTSGGQERTVDVRDGVAATSMTFTRTGETVIVADYSPSATSAYAPTSASTTVVVEESTDTTLILNGLDAPGYVAEPVILEAEINPAEGTTDPRGRVEFVAGTETRLVDVVGGAATAEFAFGRAGNVDVRATYYPTGTGQTIAGDSGTLEIIDATATDSELRGPARTEPSTVTPYTIVVSPAGAHGTATVRIDGRVVATDVPVVDGEGTVDLTFPPSAVTDRTVAVEFTPDDARALRPHTSRHVIAVSTAQVDENAITMTVSGPAGPLDPGRAAPFRIEVAPTDALLSPASLNGFLTVSNNGETVMGSGDVPVRIPVTRGVADVDITWTSGYPQSKYVQFTYHSADGTERGSEAVTVTVLGEGDGLDTMRVMQTVPADTGNVGGGSLDPGSLEGGSLTTILGS
ncbi:MAG: hypothetical protein ACK4UY_02165 [Dietzia sp.]